MVLGHLRVGPSIIVVVPISETDGSSRLMPKFDSCRTLFANLFEWVTTQPPSPAASGFVAWRLKTAHVGPGSELIRKGRRSVNYYRYASAIMKLIPPRGILRLSECCYRHDGMNMPLPRCLERKVWGEQPRVRLRYRKLQASVLQKGLPSPWPQTSKQEPVHERREVVPYGAQELDTRCAIALTYGERSSCGCVTKGGRETVL